MEEKKDVYQQKIEAKLKEWDAGIQQLKSKAEQAEAEAKIQYLNRIEELKGKKENLDKKLDELKKSSGGAWEDVKAGLESAYNEMKTAMDSAMSRFQ